MGIPIGKDYIATLTGSALKSVQCDNCGCDYLYEAKRRVSGSGSSLLFLDNQGAERRAANRAQEKLAQQLEEAVEMVACPECGRYQQMMVKKAKRRRFGWTLGMGLAIALVLLGWGALWAFAYRDVPRATNTVGSGSVPKAYVAAALCLAVVSVAASTLWYAVHDPNANLSEHKRAKRAAASRGIRRSELEAAQAKRARSTLDA